MTFYCNKTGKTKLPVAKKKKQKNLHFTNTALLLQLHNNYS